MKPQVSVSHAAVLSRIVVIDDHPFFREGLVGWLNAQAGLTCCGEAATVAQGIEVIDRTGPDLVLLDLQFKEGDGIDLLAELSKRSSRPAVIVISRMDEDVYASRVIRAGARGYVMKEQGPEVLLEAIRVVRSGGVYVGPGVVDSIAAIIAHASGDPKSALANLSNREIGVFERIGRGMSSKAIAAELGLSIKTVESYRESLKRKLGLPDSHTLVRAATLWHQDSKLPGSK